MYSKVWLSILMGEGPYEGSFLDVMAAMYTEERIGAPPPFLLHHFGCELAST